MSMTLTNMKKNKIKSTFRDQVFLGVCYTLVILLLIITICPLLNVLVSSISDPMEVGAGNVFILPKGISFEGYKEVFNHSEILIGYANTIFYTITRTALTMCVTIPAGYALSVPGLIGKKIFVVIMMITWYFGGGLVPQYLLIRDLNLYNTRTVVILLGCWASQRAILCKTFFAGIPSEMREAAEIDGCGTFRYFISIALPLSKALLGVMMLYFVVGSWNEYFTSMMYLADQDKFPLQLVLRDLLVVNKAAAAVEDAMAYEAAQVKLNAAEQLKYGVIVISSAPMLILFPFVQKYFDKGVLIGSLKG